MKLEFELGDMIIGKKGVTIDIKRKGLNVGLLFLSPKHYSDLKKPFQISIK